MVSVVEKDPFKAGVMISWESSVIIETIAPGIVFPDIVITFLLTTSSSFGESRFKKIDGFGVGEGEAIEIVFGLKEGTVFEDS